MVPRWRLYLVERGVGTPGCICPKILIGGSLCGSPVWTSGLKILLDEGVDVELGARTSKHILLFVFDRFSLYFVHCFILLYHILVVCCCN